MLVIEMSLLHILNLRLSIMINLSCLSILRPLFDSANHITKKNKMDEKKCSINNFSCQTLLYITVF